MKPKLLMLDEMTPIVKDVLSEHVDFVYKTPNSDYSSDFTMVYTGLTPVVTNATAFCPCTGIEHIDAPKVIYLNDEFKQGIGQQVTSTAEHTWSLVLQLAKMNKMQLNNKTIGIIGFGRIGRRIKEYSDAFGMNVNAKDITKFGYAFYKNKLSEKCVMDDYIFKSSDIITLHAPLNEATSRMIGREEIEMMKDGALFVNTARWQLVDEFELIKALKSGKLAGYAHDFKPQIHTDTTERWNMWMNSGVHDKVIATPHIGGNCHEAREITDRYIADKIIEYINK